MFKKLHLLNRFLCSILVLFTIYFVDNFYWFFLLHLVLIVIYFLEGNNKSLDFIVFSAILSFFGRYYWFLTLVCKILLVIGVISNFYFLLSKNEKRWLMEKMFYPFHNISSIIRSVYYKKIYQFHQLKFNELSDFLIPVKKYKKYNLEQIKRKTEEDLKLREKLCYFRFYGTFRKRANVKSMSRWKDKDNTYLLIHVLVLVIIFLFGR